MSALDFLMAMLLAGGLASMRGRVRSEAVVESLQELCLLPALPICGVGW